MNIGEPAVLASLRVRASTRTVLVVLLLALVPLRALASVTIGFCALHGHGAASEHAAHAHHDHDDGAGQHGSNDDCNSCVEHCASASAVPPAKLPSLAPAGAQRIATHERCAGGFVPDP